ncbi:unnamed protein product [Brassicogethes aeneus]|uniref:Galactose mutarotase n=1 Tax=Brassicogethes aeneus TaxID=1431903 RepID=A0A9P0B7W8_BRAAE|nr:unnamed protein product [Brassicogethes aeneus]
MNNQVELNEDEFGLYIDKTTGDSKSVRRFTWSNKNNMEVQVITYGATITSIKVPDSKGLVEDIAFGFTFLEDYMAPKNRYFGATVGRNANRIKNAQINNDDTTNEGQLHGGFKGFDKVNWDYQRDGTKVIMSHYFPHVDEGYPEDLIVSVTFELTNNNDFKVDLKAFTTKPTLVNLTNLSYFNLAGHGKGAEELYKHIVCINADQITDVDESSNITGNLLPVSGTPFDQRNPTVLGERINNIPGNLGYDHNFCVTKGTDSGNNFIARVVHPPSGRVMELYSNQPGVQFYTSNSLPEQGKCDTLALVNGKEVANAVHKIFNKSNSTTTASKMDTPCEKNTDCNPVRLEEDQFGLYTDKTGKSTSVRRFTWKNKNNVEVQVITYGATITSIRVSDNKGLVEDIVLGFPSMEGYTAPTNPYFGATVGRNANRIGNAKIIIDGKTYSVTANSGKHQLHGGFKGFDKVNWDYHRDGTKVVMSHYSPDKDEGYPGDLIANVTFELTNNNDFFVDFKAYTSKPTLVNLTNHSYFNLAGHDKGAEELYKHVVCINADQTTPVDDNLIPSGKLQPVSGTVFDLRVPTVLGERINKIPGYSGFDHNFCITKGSDQGNTYFARVVYPPSGRVLELYSNQPGVQFYTSNFLPEEGDSKDFVEGKGGKLYWKHGGFCLETQNYPDAVNHVNFPPAILYPGETYHHTVVYKFSSMS